MEKILIVDDSEMNREILTDMLADEYEIFEAANGNEAVTLLSERNTEISLVLLDMVMPVMNGLEVLDIMNKNGWLSDLPVIMISSEDSAEAIHKGYELGVTEFIRRPFDSLIVQKRCRNITALYAKQKKLAGLVADQFYEKEKNSRVMIEILAHTVEFRNGECGMHVINVQSYTEILLRELIKITDRYKLTEADISLISTVSALHDIGKISIPDEILNKPGRLTNEEFAIMKSHSAVGSQMLSELPFYRDEPIVKLAYSIARWHHERWDGGGYPHFTPPLLTCMNNRAEEMRLVKEGNGANIRGEDEIKEFAHELLKNDAMYSSDRLLHLLEYEKMKNRFFEGITGGYSFEYNAVSDMLTLSANGAEVLGAEGTIIDPTHNETLISVFGQKTLADLSARFRSMSAEQPIVQFYVHQLITVKPGEATPVQTFRITDTAEEHRRYPADTHCNTYKLVCRTTWTLEEPQRYTGVIGKLVPAGNAYGLMKGADSNDIRSLL